MISGFGFVNGFVSNGAAKRTNTASSVYWRWRMRIGRRAEISGQSSLVRGRGFRAMHVSSSVLERCPTSTPQSLLFIASTGSSVMSLPQHGKAGRAINPQVRFRGHDGDGVGLADEGWQGVGRPVVRERTSGFPTTFQWRLERGLPASISSQRIQACPQESVC